MFDPNHQLRVNSFMNDRVGDLFKYHQEGSSKFAYFLCSVAGALFAYIAQTSQLHRLDNAFSIFQGAGILVLALSFYYGVRRIQYSNALLLYNHTVLDADERASKIARRLNSDPRPVFENRGKIETRNQLKEKHGEYLEECRKAEKCVQDILPLVSRYGAFQFYLLIAGFALIFLAKVLQPYETDFSGRHASIIQTTNQPPHEMLTTQSSIRSRP